jgi:hypothetical protein
MTIREIQQVETEMARVMGAIDAVRTRWKQKDNNLFVTGSPETGALRRASLDLSRALVALRRDAKREQKGERDE